MPGNKHFKAFEKIKPSIYIYFHPIGSKVLQLGYNKVIERSSPAISCKNLVELRTPSVKSTEFDTFIFLRVLINSSYGSRGVHARGRQNSLPRGRGDANLGILP